MSDAEVTLRKLLDKVIEEPYKNGTVTLKALNSGGANYTSALYSVTIAANHEEDLKLFAKVANISGKLRELMNVKLMFDTEVIFYTDLIKTYERIQDKYKLPEEYRFKYPKFYGGDSCEGKETVLLEDLVFKGYGPYSRFKTIDWEHATTAIESLARFHALSFAFEREDPENFAKAIEKMTYKPPEITDDPDRKEMWRKMMAGCIQVAKEEHKEAISNFLLDESSRKEVYKYKEPLHKPVLCHGDYRISNLLFQRQNGRLTTIVLDFQTLHTGCAPMDLLYLEFMGTNEEFRRENHQKIIDYYFQELTLALDRFGLNVDDVYPREMFDLELEQMLPVALRTASFILPLVLVEAESAPQLGECDNVEKIAISPNQLFAERFSGIISDCVRWNVI